MGVGPPRRLGRFLIPSLGLDRRRTRLGSHDALNGIGRSNRTNTSRSAPSRCSANNLPRSPFREAKRSVAEVSVIVAEQEACELFTSYRHCAEVVRAHRREVGRVLLDALTWN